MSSPIVLLSSFNDEQRRKFTSLVEKLGGRVLQSVGYDQRCTHVVVGAILSTEKLLAGAIAGKWVVSPEYVECSYKAKKWLEAEKFVLHTVGSGSVKKLSEVPTRWRNFRQQNGNQGPFRSWRVLLALPDADKIRYKRLLQAGGAHVISDKPPYVWSVKTSDKLTFVFTNKDLFITVMSLYKKGVPCIHPDYVKDFIIQQHRPDVTKYRANVYAHPVKKSTNCGYRKITSYIFTTPNSSSTTRALSVRDKNITHRSNRTRKIVGVKQYHSKSVDVMSLSVSIPLDKIVLKRSCDPVIDLTTACVMSQPPSECVTTQLPSDCIVPEPPSDCIDIPSDCIDIPSDCVDIPSDCIDIPSDYIDCSMSQPPVSTQSSSDGIVLDLPSNFPILQPSTDCVMLQPPSDCVMLQPPSDCVMSQPPSDCVMSQPPSDCVMSQPLSDCVMSQPLSDCVMSQSSSDCVVSQPLSDCTSIRLSSDCIVLEPHIVSQPPTDCVMSQPASDDDTFKVQCADEDMDKTSHDGVLATRLRFSSEPEHTKRCGRKRKRKCLSVPELPKQEGQQYNNNMAIEEEEMVEVSKGTMSDHLPVINMMLHQRGLWTSRYSDDGQVVMKTSVDTLLEGYLSDQQSLSRGVKYCYSLLSSHVPSATLLYQLTSKLLCDQLDDNLVAMVSMTLTKLLLLHPPHGAVARQQYYKLFDLLTGDYKCEYRKWEGLSQGITNNRPHLLQYLTNIIIMDYHRWLLLSSQGDQPLLHKVMWDNRSCDTVSRPVKELSQCFIKLLNSYHDDKYPYLESLCYFMFLTHHYLQIHSVTPTVPAAPPPHLQAAKLGCSVLAREHMIKHCHDINDYCNCL